MRNGQKTDEASHARATRVPAQERPVGTVLPLLGLPHLDRGFDYLIPESLSADAVPGCRVRIRFAGRLVDGFLLRRLERTDHRGELAWLERVVSPERVLTPELWSLVDTVAARWMGVRSDVLRLAIPPRHAGAEKSVPPPVPVALEPVQGPVRPLPGWAGHPLAPAFLAAVHTGQAARGVWTCPPGEDWAARLAEIADEVYRRGRQCLLLVPDQRDLDRLTDECRALTGDKDLVADLSAGLGPQARYRRWLRAVRGHARIVVGTRSAVFTPLPEPGLLVLHDDGDESYVEPRAPYPHTRDVAVERSRSEGLALLLSSPDRTPEVQLLVEQGWAHEIRPDHGLVRSRAPRVVALTDSDPRQSTDVAGGHTRLPAVATTLARAALERDRPVLVQVPRRGYVPTLLCDSCRAAARCRRCNGPLRPGRIDPRVGPVDLSCGWCGAHETGFRCVGCGSTVLRAGVIGAGRTAEELGRMFPGVRIRTSGGPDVLDRVESGPAVIVCTPGAEPIAEGGYGCALLLDAWALLGRTDLRAHQQALHRWIGAAALVVPACEGGAVFLSVDGALPVAQALVRWDPAGWASRELAERREVGFPPAVHLVALDAPAASLADVVDGLETVPGVQMLGPVDLPEGISLPGGDDVTDPERLLIRVPASELDGTAASIRAFVAARSGRRAPGPLRVQLDPARIG